MSQHSELTPAEMDAETVSALPDRAALPDRKDGRYRMKHQETLIVGGVDAHADSHHAAALDERGALLGSEAFATTRDG